MSTWHLFTDESGAFSEAGDHVIAVIAVPNRHLERASEWWAHRCPDWPSFHAVEENDATVARLVDELHAGLIDHGGFARCFHARTVVDRPDFHLAMRDWSLAQVVAQLVQDEPPPTFGAARWKLAVRVWPEHRASADLALSENTIRQISRRLVDPGFAQAQIAAVHCGMDVIVYDVPPEASPLVAAADLLSHGMRDAARKPRQPSGAGRLPTLRTVDVDEAVAARRLAQRSLLAIADGLDLAALPSAAIAAELDTAAARLPLDSVASTLHQLARLAESQVEHKRAFATGRWLADRVVRWAVDRRPSASDTDELDAIILYAIAVWLLACDHLGECAGDTSHAIAGGEIAERLMADPACQADVAFFCNVRAVAYQNAGQDQRADEALWPLVDYFTSNRAASPFGRSPRARWIGAAIGTFAQNLALRAHRQWLDGTLDAAGLGAASQEAALYSTVACDHFTATEDRARQQVYRAHFALQRFAIAGGEDALAEARGELELEHLGDHAAAFAAGLPHGATGPLAYRLAVGLKYCWLAGDRPAWIVDLAKALRTHGNKLPAQHPVEQLLGYCALLLPASSRSDALRLHARLGESKWQAGLVATIAATFACQIEAAEHAGITPAVARARLLDVGGDLGPRVLAAQGKTRFGLLPGLPFNYW